MPTVSRKNVKLRVENLWRKRIEERTPKTVRKMKKWGKKKIKLPDIIDKLFDVIDDAKVPEIEKEFVADQRTNRELYIMNVTKSYCADDFIFTLRLNLTSHLNFANRISTFIVKF